MLKNERKYYQEALEHPTPQNLGFFEKPGF